MTKSVRIENGDTSDHKVRAQVQVKDAEGNWVNDGPPVSLDYPTAMANITIWRGKRFIVEEA